VQIPSRMTIQRWTTGHRDHVIMWAKDVGRSIDYLQSRPDVAKDKIGYIGLSWSGMMAPIVLAVEPRNVDVQFSGRSGRTQAPRRVRVVAHDPAQRDDQRSCELDGEVLGRYVALADANVEEGLVSREGIEHVGEAEGRSRLPEFFAAKPPRTK
jgi:hypothetical protein